MAVTPWGESKRAPEPPPPQPQQRETVKQGPWVGSAHPDRFDAFSPAQWQGRDAPAQRWIVEGLMAAGTVAMVSGDGGLGKSLLMQQLMTAAALGQSWLGFPTAKVRSIGVFCEDPRDELHRRQMQINRHYGCEMGDLGEDVMMSCRIDRESYLSSFEKWTDAIKPTPLWEQVARKCQDFGAQILVLDTVRKTFGGNEISDRQVSRFISMLRRLAIAIEGVVILTAHPSNEGVSSGSGIAGSRAWNNDVRSRMYLTRKGKDDSDQNLRVLKTMKSNYAAAGGKTDIRWRDGVFVRTDLTVPNHYEPQSEMWR